MNIDAVYTASINQPTICSQGPEYKSTAAQNQQDYDFLFEEERKRRPKTPYKRNNMYERA